MTTATEYATESRLTNHGYSTLFIRPLWYRAYRALGIRVPLPVQMNFPEHLLFGGLPALILLTAGYGAAWEAGLVSRFPVLLVAGLTLFLPALNWVRYRAARHSLAG